MEAFRQYLPLCWFKANPLELVRSMLFFKQNLWFYFIVEYLLQANMTDDPFESLVEVCIETVLTLVFIGFMLFLNKTLYAYIQVTTAILVCANVVSVFITPIMIWLTVSEQALSYYVMGVLLTWEFALTTYIIKQVLAVNYFASLVLSAAYFLLTYFGAFALGQLV